MLPRRDISEEKNKSFAASSSNSHHLSLLHCQYSQEWRKILEKTCQSAPPTLVCVSCNFRQQLQRRGLTGLTVYRHHHLWTVDRHWQRLLWYRPFSTASDAEPDTGEGTWGRQASPRLKLSLNAASLTLARRLITVRTCIYSLHFFRQWIFVMIWTALYITSLTWALYVMMRHYWSAPTF